MKQFFIIFQLLLLLLVLLVEQALTLPIWFLFFTLLFLLSINGIERLFCIVFLGCLLSLQYQALLGLGVILILSMLFFLSKTRKYLLLVDLRIIFAWLLGLLLSQLIFRQPITVIVAAYYCFVFLVIASFLLFRSRKQTILKLSRFL